MASQANNDDVCFWAKTFECRMAFSVGNDPFKNIPLLWSHPQHNCNKCGVPVHSLCFSERFNNKPWFEEGVFYCQSCVNSLYKHDPVEEGTRFVSPKELQTKLLDWLEADTNTADMEAWEKGVLFAEKYIKKNNTTDKVTKIVNETRARVYNIERPLRTSQLEDRLGKEPSDDYDKTPAVEGESTPASDSTFEENAKAADESEGEGAGAANAPGAGTPEETEPAPYTPAEPQKGATIDADDRDETTSSTSKALEAASQLTSLQQLTPVITDIPAWIDSFIESERSWNQPENTIRWKEMKLSKKK